MTELDDEGDDVEDGRVEKTTSTVTATRQWQVD